MVLPTPSDGDSKEDFEAAFKRVYKAEFGFLLKARVLVDDVKVRGIGKTFDSLGPSVFAEVSDPSFERREVGKDKADATHSTYFDEIGRVEDTPVFLLDRLDVGDEVRGPAMIIDDTQTIVVVPGARALATRRHLYITLDEDKEGDRKDQRRQG